MRRVKNLKHLLKKEINSPTRSQKSSSSAITEVKKILAIKPGYKLEQLKIVRMLGVTLKRLQIVPYTEIELESLRMFRLYNNEAGFHKEMTNKSLFPLIECRDYVERLYANGILPKGIVDEQQ